MKIVSQYLYPSSPGVNQGAAVTQPSLREHSKIMASDAERVYIGQLRTVSQFSMMVHVGDKVV